MNHVIRSFGVNKNWWFSIAFLYNEIIQRLNVVFSWSDSIISVGDLSQATSLKEFVDSAELFSARTMIWFQLFQPLWKIWVSQLGWWNSQYMEKKCSKPPVIVCRAGPSLTSSTFLPFWRRVSTRLVPSSRSGEGTPKRFLLRHWDPWGSHLPASGYKIYGEITRLCWYISSCRSCLAPVEMSGEC